MERERRYDLNSTPAEVREWIAILDAQREECGRYSEERALVDEDSLAAEELLAQVLGKRDA